MAANPDFTEAVLEALRRRGRTVVRVQGRSMYPTLRNGTRVEVQPVAYDELAVGDLVVFYDGRGIVCHRLIRKAHRLCYLKGDTNLWADPPVVWSQVLGRVTRLIDPQFRIRSLDTPRQRCLAALLARFSYPYALYFHLLRLLGRCRWWSRGIEWREWPHS
ncbi:MAG TPA: S24/S26 family peptidase [Chthonomonadaceae bacterium]|nr:S24/S26 family peptidase [Chthonomonadaceae bacterium]